MEYFFIFCGRGVGLVPVQLHCMRCFIFAVCHSVDTLLTLWGCTHKHTITYPSPEEDSHVVICVCVLRCGTCRVWHQITPDAARWKHMLHLCACSIEVRTFHCRLGRTYTSLFVLDFWQYFLTFVWGLCLCLLAHWAHSCFRFICLLSFWLIQTWGVEATGDNLSLWCTWTFVSVFFFWF